MEERECGSVRDGASSLSPVKRFGKGFGRGEYMDNVHNNDRGRWGPPDQMWRFVKLNFDLGRQILTGWDDSGK